MNDNDILQLTELDNLVSKNQLQMIKAAIPYISVNEQRLFSVFVKAKELMNTVSLCEESADNSIGICSLETEETSPVDMMNAMKKYASEPERDFIDLVTNFLEASNLYQSYVKDTETPPHPFTPKLSIMDLLMNMLNPEQQSMFETYQMLMQTMGLN